MIQIEPFRIRHLPRVRAIETAAFADDAYPPDLFREHSADPRCLFLIGKYKRRIAGYIIVCASGGKAELVSIAVDERYRRHRVGSAMLRRAIARLRKAGVANFRLMVRVSNDSGIAFYRRFGFLANGKSKRYYADAEDGIRMTLTL